MILDNNLSDDGLSIIVNSFERIKYLKQLDLSSKPINIIKEIY